MRKWVLCLAALLVMLAAPLSAESLSKKYRFWDKSPEAYFLTTDERAQWKKVKVDADAEKFVGDVVATIYGALYPMGTETLYGPFQISTKTDIRLTARQLRLRLAENNITGSLTIDATGVAADAIRTVDEMPGGGVDWRIGRFRVGAIAGSAR